MTRRGYQKKLLHLAGTLRTPTWSEAEAQACDWMRKNGFRDAELTRAGADGGVDVASSRAVAQVKNLSVPVGIAPVQRLSGCAQGRAALFFSRRGYTRQAIAWADLNGVALYTIAPVMPVNRHAKRGRRI